LTVGRRCGRLQRLGTIRWLSCCSIRKASTRTPRTLLTVGRRYGGAAAKEYDAVIKLLLDKERVDPDSKDAKYGGRPLWRAAANGHEAVVKLLVEKGAELQPTIAASI
jgi:hypothetical protein